MSGFKLFSLKFDVKLNFWKLEFSMSVLTEQRKWNRLALCGSVRTLGGSGRSPGGAHRPHHQEQQAGNPPGPGGPLRAAESGQDDHQRAPQLNELQHSQAHAAAPGCTQRPQSSRPGAVGSGDGCELSGESSFSQAFKVMLLLFCFEIEMWKIVCRNVTTFWLVQLSVSIFVTT